MPSVDVFITYCGESLDVVLDTVRAALNLDYPQEKLRVVVLDDSKSIACANAIESLRNTYPNLYHTARKVHVETHSKAGNLDHGLQYVKSLDGGASDMVAVLDVDMIPEPQWLRSVLPHILKDDKVAMAGPIQDYYNLPTNDPLGQISMSTQMFRIGWTQKDFKDASWCNGSGFVVRRSAMDQIDGFPTDCLLEDFLTALKLIAAGWKVIIMQESLQWGLIPDSYAGQIKQVHRWSTGCFQFASVLRRSPLTASTSQQRVETLLMDIGFALSIFKSALCFMVMPLLMFSKSPLILVGSSQQLHLVLWLAFLDFSLHSLQGFIAAWVTDFYTHIFSDVSMLWVTPYLIPDLMRHWFPGAIKAVLGATPNFMPSGSSGRHTFESDELFRMSVFVRLKVILWDNSAFLHLGVLITCLTALTSSFFEASRLVGERRAGGLVDTWIVGAGYPYALLLWTSVIANAWVPLSYAIWDFERPNRESLLVRDPKTKVAYPSAKAKDQDHRKVTDWQFGVVAAYFVSVMVGSWWL